MRAAGVHVDVMTAFAQLEATEDRLARVRAVKRSK
jgi:hypothetical protein